MSKKRNRRQKVSRDSDAYTKWFCNQPKSFFDDLAEQEAGTLPMDEEVVTAFVDEELETLRRIAESKKR